MNLKKILKNLKRTYDSYIGKFVLCDIYLCPGMMIYIDEADKIHGGWWMIINDKDLQPYVVHFTTVLETRPLRFFLQHIEHKNVLEIYDTIEDCALGRHYALYKANKY